MKTVRLDQVPHSHFLVNFNSRLICGFNIEPHSNSTCVFGNLKHMVVKRGEDTFLTVFRMHIHRVYPVDTTAALHTALVVHHHHTCWCGIFLAANPILTDPLSLYQACDTS